MDDLVTNDFHEVMKSQGIYEIKNKFLFHLRSLKNNGPTSELWVQYFHMVTILKKIIEAEKSGDFELHLKCVEQMIPYFHASGHFLYAKSAHLYLQDMTKLEEKLPIF